MAQPHAAVVGKRMLNASTGEGRIVFISGAASPKGFGKVSAVLLAQHGARVVISDLPQFEEAGKKIVAEIEAEGGKAFWTPLDVTDEEQWKVAIAAAEKAFGPLDVIVNNAGIGMEWGDYMRNTEASISQHPTADWRRICAINQDGVYYGMKYGAASMEKNPVPEGKSIINISSMAGFVGQTGFGYTATKWAVRGMTKHGALVLAHKNIRCNSIHPAYAETNILDPVLHNPDPEVAKAQTIRLNGAQPLGRLGQPIEIANLVLYLASTESSFTSGAEHIIDGAFNTTAGYSQNPFGAPIPANPGPSNVH